MGYADIALQISRLRRVSRLPLGSPQASSPQNRRNKQHSELSIILMRGSYCLGIGLWRNYTDRYVVAQRPYHIELIYYSLALAYILSLPHIKLCPESLLAAIHVASLEPSSRHIFNTPCLPNPRDQFLSNMVDALAQDMRLNCVGSLHSIQCHKGL